MSTELVSCETLVDGTTLLATNAVGVQNLNMDVDIDALIRAHWFNISPYAPNDQHPSFTLQDC